MLMRALCPGLNVSARKVRGVKTEGWRAGVRPDVFNKLPCHKVRCGIALIVFVGALGVCQVLILRLITG